MSSETGILFDLKRFAVHDGPGIRTTVFFKGCPLRCRWCHNPESQHLLPEKKPPHGFRKCGLSSTSTDELGREMTVEAVMEEVRKDVIFYDESGGGVTFSGGEPLLQYQFLKALLEACREQGLHTTVDTSGYAPWKHFEQLYDKANLFLYDLKLMDEEAHRTYTDVGNRRILDNLQNLHRAGANIIVRIPLIPGITDTDDNLLPLIDFIASMDNLQAVNLLPYNPLEQDKHERLRQPSPFGALHTQSEEELAAIQHKFSPLPFDVTIGG